MEREANYTAVGAFVLLIVTMAALFVYWYAGSSDARDYKRYEIYFEGSVSGLNRGSTVRYLGVEVGRVVAIRIDKRAADRVQVIADIDSQAPISKRHAGVAVAAGCHRTAVHRPAGERRCSSARWRQCRASSTRSSTRCKSNFDLFLASLPDLVGRAAEVADRASRVLSDENLAAFNSTMRSIEQSAATLPATMRDAAEVVAAVQGHRGRCARRRGRRPHAHRHLGAGPGHRRRTHPQDLGESRDHHGQSRPAHDATIAMISGCSCATACRRWSGWCATAARRRRNSASCRAASRPIPHNCCTSRATAAWRFPDEAAGR